MIWFASSIAFVAWVLVKAFDGRWPPSRYLILWSPRVRFCNSVARHRIPSGHDRARMERFSEWFTFLESSLYCHAMRAFSAALKKNKYMFIEVYTLNWSILVLLSISKMYARYSRISVFYLIWYRFIQKNIENTML